jgi:hypothetical protein
MASRRYTSTLDEIKFGLALPRVSADPKLKMRIITKHLL